MAWEKGGVALAGGRGHLAGSVAKGGRDAVGGVAYRKGAWLTARPRPQLAEQSLMKSAIKTSEESWIEQQMLEDKKRATDWEATNEAIEEQVARESYLQWLRDQEKQARQVCHGFWVRLCAPFCPPPPPHRPPLGFVSPSLSSITLITPIASSHPPLTPSHPHTLSLSTPIPLPHNMWGPRTPPPVPTGGAWSCPHPTWGGIPCCVPTAAPLQLPSYMNAHL